MAQRYLCIDVFRTIAFANRYFRLQVLLPLFLLLTGLQQGFATCQASFTFTFLDNHQVVLFNTSNGYVSYEWDVSPSLLAYDDGQVASFTMQQDTTWICLHVWDQNGWEDVQCQAIFDGAPGEVCEISDCIWPGDADTDGKANIYDLLYLGLEYGAAGPPRNFFPIPSNPIAWAPNFGDDWSQNINALNAKHFDCNGDGIVDQDDMDAIQLNYTPEFDYTSAPAPGAPPVFLELENPVIVINDNTPSTFTITANLVLGEAAFPIENAYGIALDIDYPEEYLVPGGASIQYDNTSFFGPSSEVLTLSHDVPDQGVGRYDWASTHTQGLGASGHGRLATITCVVSSDIIGGIAEPEVPFNLIIERVRVLNGEGGQIIINLPNGGIYTTILINDTVAKNGDTPGQSVQIFPNPAKGWLYVEWKQIEATRLELLDLVGKPVLSQTVNGRSARVPVQSLSPGLYWALLYTEEGTVVRRIQIQ